MHKCEIEYLYIYKINTVETLFIFLVAIIRFFEPFISYSKN